MNVDMHRSSLRACSGRRQLVLRSALGEWFPVSGPVVLKQTGAVAQQACIPDTATCLILFFMQTLSYIVITRLHAGPALQCPPKPLQAVEAPAALDLLS